jgi:hypothetical protein
MQPKWLIVIINPGSKVRLLLLFAPHHSLSCVDRGPMISMNDVDEPVATGGKHNMTICSIRTEDEVRFR